MCRFTVRLEVIGQSIAQLGVLVVRQETLPRFRGLADERKVGKQQHFWGVDLRPRLKAARRRDSSRLQVASERLSDFLQPLTAGPDLLGLAVLKYWK